MTIYTPGFNKRRRVLASIFLKYFVNPNRSFIDEDFKTYYTYAEDLDLAKIGRFVEKLKKDLNKTVAVLLDLGESFEEIKDVLDSVDFDYMTDDSDEIDEVIVDMIRHALIEETRKGYKLTILGFEGFAKKSFKELYESLYR